MRYIKYLFQVSIFLFSFSHAKGQSPLVDSLFHPDSLRRIVEVLASDSFQGRLTGTDENLKAALFIAEEFRKAGLHPVAGNAGFFQQIQPSWYNVIGAIKGRSKPGQLIIFSAHYDHIGTRSNNPDPRSLGRIEKDDEIYNGANDNASGVSAVISLSKYFKALNNNERTLIFVAFTGEELGLIGSQFLARNWETDSIVAMINIEMIGRGEYQNSRPFITGYEKSNFIDVLNRNYRILAGKYSEKEFFKADQYLREFLFMRSDNYPFALKGVPAHTITVTTPDDIFYHSPNDETETLDFDLMKKVIHAIAISSTGLVEGVDKVTRIKKAN